VGSSSQPYVAGEVGGSFPRAVSGNSRVKLGRWNFYAVSRGRRVGIYRSWLECEEQVRGFSGAIFKGFKT
jgi:hypothetical protein